MNQANATSAPAGLLRKIITALGMLVAVTIVIGIFIALCYAVGITDFWPAFLFVLYWTMIDHADLKKLPRCIVGAFVGLFACYLSQTLPQTMGPSGGLVFLGFVLVLVFNQLMGWLPVAVNAMTMLYLTVGTSTVLQAHANFNNAFAALALGIVFFGGLISIGKFFKERAAKH